MAERIAELEIKLAYAEDLLDSVNTTVFRQQEQIDLLQAQLRSLQQQVQTSMPGEALSLRDELPPHY
ncbi:MAG: SlyX family protein [Rhodocyclaceae bacterium]|nr:SlyX family protein [Rhodocyclaceae bacterium]